MMTIEDIQESTVAHLTSEHRRVFLALLAYNLTMAARGVYVEAGNEPEAAAADLRCHNELLMVVAKQLRYSSGEPDKGYPDRAFVEVLAEKAKAGGCASGLRWALERALRDVPTIPERREGIRRERGDR